MPLVEMKDMLQHAYQHGYAVGAFEVVGLDFLEGIMQGAEKARAPIILSLSESHFKCFDYELMMPAVEAAAKRASVPVAIHFDHGTCLDSALKGIKHGCNGVMVDASHLEFSENVEITKEVVTTAHACGVAVEGELGCIPGVEGEGAEFYPGDSAYTSVAEAKVYVERTAVDFLAVSIGTVHGRMKGKPKLDYQRLKQINEALQIPLVIHGGSGLTGDQFHRLISNGVAKINCYTALTEVVTKQIKQNIKAASNSYLGVVSGLSDAVADEVERCMRLWGSAGRAAEVMTRCLTWTSVEHMVIFNVEGMEQERAEVLLAEGLRVISAIPGVRDVFPGKAVQEKAQYKYTWLVRFCHPMVIENYRQHPDYVSFNEKLFRPVAGHSISIDFKAMEPVASQPYIESRVV